MARALDKAKKDYYKRLRRWSIPAFFVGVIGLIMFFIGLWIRSADWMNVGLLFFGIGFILYSMGRWAHGKFKKQ